MSPLERREPGRRYLGGVLEQTHGSGTNLYDFRTGACGFPSFLVLFFLLYSFYSGFYISDLLFLLGFCFLHRRKILSFCILARPLAIQSMQCQSTNVELSEFISYHIDTLKKQEKKKHNTKSAYQGVNLVTQRNADK